MTIPETILQQLGGDHFLAVTGAHHLIKYENKILMTLTQNRSKANSLEIILTDDGLYRMRFYRYIAPRFGKNYTPEKEVEIEQFEGLRGDQLREIYERVTGQRTK